MLTAQEFNPQALQVFCQNIGCGTEKLNTMKRISVAERRHRRMMYAGSHTLGYLDLLFGSIFREYDFPESGTYHFYSCPVCGTETIYLEKRGVIKRVYCGQLAMNA